MTQDMRGFLPPACELLGLGEPTHLEPAFGIIRNELLGRLAAHGFRSIALETDRVAALAVNDFVRDGVGALDTVLREGFSHTFGALDTNRRLVVWMREYNQGRPEEERLAFHGFDIPTEMFSAPSPLSYLEHARDYLELDPGVDLAGLAGEEQRWSRTEAIMDPAMSIGAGAEAERLRVVADDMLTLLFSRAPQLIAKTSRARWFRAKTQLTAALDLLRYHRQAAVPGLEQSARISRLSATRDALMARNLLDIRAVEDPRGPTLVFAHNQHLQRNTGRWQLADMDLSWQPAGAIVGSLLGDRYAVIAGSLGRSDAIGLGAPDPDTYEGPLQERFATWGLTASAAVAAGRKRTDTIPEQGYFPLDQEVLAGTDAILHVAAGAATA